jgi:flagellar hook-basal body complex protein FliE
MNISSGIAQRLAQMAVNASNMASATGAAGVGGAGGPGGLGGGAGAGGANFGDALKRAVSEVSATQENSRAHVDAFLRGEEVELHQVMAAAEEAGIALEMLIEIRNKFTEAYRTVINMQS